MTDFIGRKWPREVELPGLYFRKQLPPNLYSGESQDTSEERGGWVVEAHDARHIAEGGNIARTGCNWDAAR